MKIFHRRHRPLNVFINVFINFSAASFLPLLTRAAGVRQVVMRWITQLGIPLVSASNVTAYDVEDTEIFAFNLTDSEMATLSAL